MKSAAEVNDLINEDIVEVIGNFISLKRHGRDYKACCPFHNEDTPSFSVSPAKGIYKCFGCGAGGDAVSFIMKHEQKDWKEALEIGAKKLNIDFEWKNQESHNPERYQHQEALKIANQYACEFYQQQLTEHKQAMDYYVTERKFSFSEDDPFMPGYAPDGQVLLKWAQAKGIKLNILLDAGLVKQNEDNKTYYDTFRNRLVFPICDKTGKILGFTGRTLEKDRKDVAKWLNTADTEIFNKGKQLFALNIARGEIAKVDRAYLVEGGFDVKRLHEIGITNTVAGNGTALTDEQAELLKKYTNKVTLIYDGDMAGMLAMKKNAEILIKHKFYVSVIVLPEKDDPDTAFMTKEDFEAYNKQQADYLIYKVTQGKAKAKGPVEKSEVIKETAALIACYDEQLKVATYLDAVSDIIGPKKAWQDQIKLLVEDKPKEKEEKKSYIPKHVDLDEVRRWGFYVDRNSYHFRKRGEDIDYETKSNFVMTPLFHIESTINAKRLYEVKNEDGITRVIEIPQKDMVSIAAFKVRVESLGNFLWWGSEGEFNKVKAWLYAKTESCKEIVQLGWNKEGFFAWGNGIYNGKYTEADKYGIVKHHDNNYYLPACSLIFSGDESLFEFERKFRHIEGNITMKEYVKQFTTVFGGNGRIALIYTFASLFRDIIVNRFDKYPMMNLFGPKGAGKNACAESLLYFFGTRQKVPNLHNTSKAALGEHVATSSNAICVFDEYRNDLEMEKREFLKGLWDGTGRTKINMDKDKKKETTHVDQGVIICGQQMATADIALFSRFVVLSFTQTEYSDEEKKNFEKLEQTNKMGLTHITHQILRIREKMKEHYRKAADETAQTMTDLMGSAIVETRIFNNWLCIMAAYTIMHNELDLPWDYEETMKIAVDLMITQNAEIKKSDDLGQFWKIVQYLITSNLLFDGGDYKTGYVDKVNQRYMENGDWKTKVIEYPTSKRILWLTTSRVFSLYKQQCGKEGDKPLPETTIEYYLRNSKAFLVETKKESFKKIDPRTGQQEEHDGKKLRTSTTAMLFDLDVLGLTVHEEEGGTQVDLPF